MVMIEEGSGEGKERGGRSKKGKLKRNSNVHIVHFMRSNKFWMRFKNRTFSIVEFHVSYSQLNSPTPEPRLKKNPTSCLRGSRHDMEVQLRTSLKPLCTILPRGTWVPGVPQLGPNNTEGS